MQKDRRVDQGMKWSPVFGRYCFLDQGGKGEGRTVRVGDRVEVGERNGGRTRFGEFCVFFSFFFLREGLICSFDFFFFFISLGNFADDDGQIGKVSPLHERHASNRSDLTQRV